MDLAWRGGKLSSATVRAALAGEHLIRTPQGREVKLKVKPGGAYPLRFD